MTQSIAAAGEPSQRRLFVGGPWDGRVVDCPIRYDLTVPVEPSLDELATDMFLESVYYVRRQFGVTGCTFPVMTVSGRPAEPVEVFRAIAIALNLPASGLDYHREQTR